MSRFKLSVVIIAHNEEEPIANTIRSVMKAASQARELLKSYEIILVDDNSSDKTVDIASRFPITILQHERQLGPSAARYTGHKYAAPDADYLLFVDGDTTLSEDWLPKAVQYMLGRPNVAGVSGNIVKILGTTTSNPRYIKFPTGTLYGSPQRDLHGGAAIYRKKVLDQAGSFDPWVLGSEELELGFRIRQKNFELHSLNILIAFHHLKKKEDNVFHRINFYRGVGQLLRVYRGTPLALELLQIYFFNFFVFGWIVICMPVALLSLLGLIHPLLWAVIAVISVLGYLATAGLKGGFSKAATILIVKFLGFFGILVGLTKKRGNTTFPSARLLKKGVQISI